MLLLTLLRGCRWMDLLYFMYIQAYDFVVCFLFVCCFGMQWMSNENDYNNLYLWHGVKCVWLRELFVWLREKVAIWMRSWCIYESQSKAAVWAHRNCEFPLFQSYGIRDRIRKYIPSIMYRLWKCVCVLCVWMFVSWLNWFTCKAQSAMLSTSVPFRRLRPICCDHCLGSFRSDHECCLLQCVVPAAPTEPNDALPCGQILRIVQIQAVQTSSAWLPPPAALKSWNTRHN